VALDLVIRGATVVTPGHQEVADIGIADGRIAQLGGAMAGARELAAGHPHTVSRTEFPRQRLLARGAGPGAVG